MWEGAGVARCAAGLRRLLREIADYRNRWSRVRAGNAHETAKALELQHMLVVSEMVARASLEREESRGAHYRTDYPAENDARWLKTIVIRRQGHAMTLEAVALEKVDVS
jgi:succinate dehydrogenase / fumarate reductase flavoprotein subunit